MSQNEDRSDNLTFPGRNIETDGNEYFPSPKRIENILFNASTCGFISIRIISRGVILIDDLIGNKDIV